MFCETCGKKLIRGYSFCVDCGTPVPPGAFDQEEEVPVTELKPGMGNDDAMPGIAPKRTSDGGANLSSGSRVPLFNTDNTGLGGLGLEDPNQAFVNLFGNPSLSPSVNNSGFNSGSSNIDMPSIEAPAKTTQAKQKHSEKGETVLLNDFSMSSAAGDETLEISDNAVTVLGGSAAEMGAGADIDLSPYKFLDNKLDMSDDLAPEPEPAAVEPEPVAIEPEPVAVEPEPVAIEPEPVAVEPEPAAVEPEPVAIEPEPVAVEPEPVAVEPEPAAVEPEPVAVEPEPVAVEPEPVAVEPEPVAVEPEPVAVEPEPVAVEPEPVAVEPEPVAVEPEPVAVEPEPVAVEPEPVAEEPLVFDGDDFVPEEMQVIEESSPFIEESAVSAAAVAVAQASEPEAKSGGLPEPMAANPTKSESKPETKSVGLPEPMAAAPARSATKPGASEKPAYDPVLGKLVYCRTCGQDMYEKEEVCKNCGAKRKPPYVPPKRKDEPKKLFGILPLSAVIGMASVVVVMTALIIFLAVKSGDNKVPIDSDISGSSVTGSSAPVSTASSAGGSSAGVSSSSKEPEESSSPEESSASSSSAPEDSTPSSSSSATPVSSSRTPVSTPKSASSTRSTPKSTYSRPQSSSKPPVVTPPSDSMTLQAALSEPDRRRLADTAAIIVGEVGKIHTYSQLATKTVNGDSQVPARLKSSLMSSIENGRKTVDSAMSSISSVNADLVSCKKAVENLRARYDEYYKYAKQTSKLDPAMCNAYYNAIEQQLRTVRLNQYTSSYNSNDKRLAIESMNSTAVADINATFTKFYNLRETFSKTSLNHADTAYSMLASGSNLFCDILINSYKVKAYGILMGDNATIKNNFDNLNRRINVYINLDDYEGNFDGFYKAAY